jgi:hypothetical protein
MLEATFFRDIYVEIGIWILGEVKVVACGNPRSASLYVDCESLWRCISCDDKNSEMHSFSYSLHNNSHEGERKKEREREKEREGSLSLCAKYLYFIFMNITTDLHNDQWPFIINN